jgi:hypothetical protein
MLQLGHVESNKELRTEHACANCTGGINGGKRLTLILKMELSPRHDLELDDSLTRQLNT